MLNGIELTKLDDYFVDLGKRRIQGVYVYRVNGYNQQIHAFIRRYYESARTNGIIIEGKLQNPTQEQLSNYDEIMGKGFEMSEEWICSGLEKWLPRMKHRKRIQVAGAMYHTLLELRQCGKNDAMLKNAYIKFMCWLYYRLEQIVNRLGDECLPKILYEGYVGMYELLLMNVLAAAGCDILLIQYHGDSDYLAVDPDSSKSRELKLPDMTSFPLTFCLKQMRQDIQDDWEKEQMYGGKPQYDSSTNTWITGMLFDDVRKAADIRGKEKRVYYNCFYRVNGVPDKNTYQNELYQFQLELKQASRNLVIVNHGIEPPTVEEIQEIRRKTYTNKKQMISDLIGNIRCVENLELQRIMVRAFVDTMLEEECKKIVSLNRLMNKAVYLLCWLKRYQSRLFQNWHMPEVSCFLYFGGCSNENEAMFCRFLAKLPVDVLIFHLNVHQNCCLEDEILYEVTYEQTLELTCFPENCADIQVGTVAYHAERELDSLIYQDTGIYRNNQYVRANAVSLQTMYEEIVILWEQELKYRPNFSTVNDVVNLPVIFSKICGVKDGALPFYWNHIKKLITLDTMVIREVPHITSVSPNPIKPFVTGFFRNGRLQKEKIRNHKAYPYKILRESMQNFMLEKLQLLIEQRLIKGTFEIGTEYTIAATALNLEPTILRMIQKFDFTKKNPKLIYIITGENALSLEDSIYTAFLHLIGFDILFFVPTGYQCIEAYFNRKVIEEHQIGEYLYDLQVPDFACLSEPAGTRTSWHERIYGYIRGGS